MKKLLLVLGVILVLLVAVVLVWTAQLTSRQVEVEPVTDIQIDAQQVAEHLAQALRFRTVSPQDLEQVNAEEFLALHGFFEQAFPQVHTTLAKEIVADYSLLYSWPGRDENLQPILLMGHMDTVQVDPAAEDFWTHPPFEGRIANGYIWGRGALDDKGLVVAILEAVETLLGQGFQPRRTVYLAFGHNEETTGWGAAAIVFLLQSRGVDLEYVLDEGGAIADGIMGLSSPVALVGISEKGYVSVELTAESPGGHSSVPPPDTAIGTLSEAIRKLEQNQMPGGLQGIVRDQLEFLAPEVPFLQRMMFANLWLFGGLVESRLEAVPRGNAMLRTTTAPTMFNAGIQENVLPTVARAVVNFRIMPGDSIESVTEHVRTTIGESRVKVRVIEETSSGPSPISSIDSPSFEMLTRTIRQIFPEALVTPHLVLGATDARHYTKLSANVYRFKPFIGQPMETTHGIDERVCVKGYVRAVEFFVQVLRNSAQ